MKAHVAHIYSSELYVIVLLGDDDAIVVHADPEDPDPPLDAAQDVTAWVPDLLTIALNAPEHPEPQAARLLARVSLVSASALARGEIIPAGDIEHCCAIVTGPRLHQSEVIGPDRMLPLVAVGLVNQVIGSIAAREAGDLDLQLRHLTEAEGPKEF
jgi:hypothetical protein